MAHPSQEVVGQQRERDAGDQGCNGAEPKVSCQPDGSDGSERKGQHRPPGHGCARTAQERCEHAADRRVEELVGHRERVVVLHERRRETVAGLVPPGLDRVLHPGVVGQGVPAGTMIAPSSCQGR